MDIEKYTVIQNTQTEEKKTKFSIDICESILRFMHLLFMLKFIYNITERNLIVNSVELIILCKFCIEAKICWLLCVYVHAVQRNLIRWF